MSNPIKTTANASDICDLVDTNASVQEQMVAQLEQNGNGLIAIQRGNGTTYNEQVGHVLDGVVSGVTVTSITTLTVTLGSGQAQLGAAHISVAGAAVTHAAGDATNPRFDLIVCNASGVISLIAGTAAASPALPSAGANLILAIVYVPANAASIGDDNVYLVKHIQTPLAQGQESGQGLAYVQAAGRFLPTRAPWARISGTGTLTGDTTLTVTNALIKATDVVMVQRTSVSGTAGHIVVEDVSEGEFDVVSTEATDVGTFTYTALITDL